MNFKNHTTLTDKIRLQIIRDEINRMHQNSHYGVFPDPKKSASLFDAMQYCKEATKANKERRQQRTEQIGSALLTVLNGVDIDWTSTIEHSSEMDEDTKRFLKDAFRNYERSSLSDYESMRVERFAQISKHVLERYFLLRDRNNLRNPLNVFIVRDYEAASAMMYYQLERALEESPVYKDMYAVMEYDETGVPLRILDGVFNSEGTAQLLVDEAQYITKKENKIRTYRIITIHQGGKQYV